MTQPTWVILSVCHLVIAIIFFIRLQRDFKELKRSERNLYFWIITLIAFSIYGYLLYSGIQDDTKDKRYTLFACIASTFVALHIWPLEQYESDYPKGQRIFFVVSICFATLSFIEKNKEYSWIATIGLVYGIAIVGIRESYFNSRLPDSILTPMQFEEDRKLTLRQLVEQHVSENNLLKAIDLLLSKLPSNNDLLLDEVRLQRNRLLEVEKQFRQGLLTHDEASKHFNRIGVAILKLAKEI